MGTANLCDRVMSFIDALPPEEVEAPIDGNEVEFKWDNYHEEAIKEVDDILDDEDWDEDDYDVEVEYRQ
jgi:GTP-binding protein